MDTGQGMLSPFGDDHLLGILLLFGGALGLLVSILAGIGAALTPTLVAPGYRALVHWLPIGVAAVVCSLLGHPEMGIGIVFGTSVALLSSVVGFVGLAGSLETIPPRASRLWTLLPIATLLAFALGFQGNVGPFEALVLLAEGTLILSVWTDATSQGPWPAGSSQAPSAGSVAMGGVRAIQFLVTLSLAGVAAWAAARGARELSEHDIRYSTNALAATLLSVALALPMVGTGVTLAAQNRAWVSLTAQVGVVFLNLCVLLPTVILIPTLGDWLAAQSSVFATTQPTWEPVVFPRLNWRLDALAAVILSLVLIPVSSGRLKLDRRLAGGLIAGYCAYLLAVLIADMHA